MTSGFEHRLGSVLEGICPCCRVRLAPRGDYGRCPRCGTGWAAEVDAEEEIVLERGPVITRVYSPSSMQRGRR
jgi:tRNA(Ile2) C34 agmatinyltransferase TiaS